MALQDSAGRSILEKTVTVIGTSPLQYLLIPDRAGRIVLHCTHRTGQRHGMEGAPSWEDLEESYRHIVCIREKGL